MILLTKYQRDVKNNERLNFIIKNSLILKHYN
jgi:hypothetical protein